MIQMSTTLNLTKKIIYSFLLLYFSLTTTGEERSFFIIILHNKNLLLFFILSLLLVLFCKKRNGRNSTHCCWNSTYNIFVFLYRLLLLSLLSVIESVIRQHIPHKQIVTAVAGCSILLNTIFYRTLPRVMICW